jgi:cyclic-di-GMP phosphodiesterase, flagellum assembly factor TipF
MSWRLRVAQATRCLLPAEPPAGHLAGQAVTPGLEQSSSLAALGTPAANIRPDPADDVLSLLRAAIESNRLDLYLQPIVTLPQRKVSYL